MAVLRSEESGNDSLNAFRTNVLLVLFNEPLRDGTDEKVTTISHLFLTIFDLLLPQWEI